MYGLQICACGRVRECVFVCYVSDFVLNYANCALLSSCCFGWIRTIQCAAVVDKLVPGMCVDGWPVLVHCSLNNWSSCAVDMRLN